MGQIVAPQIGDRQFAEDVVQDRRRILDRVVALYEPCRLEPRERERVHVLLERYAVLEAQRNRDGEIVHQRAEGSAFLVHVDEDLAEPAIAVFARVQVDLVAPDGRFLNITLAAGGQFLTLARPLDDALDDAFGGNFGAHIRRLVGAKLFGDVVGLIGVVGEELRVERLRQLRAVAVERIGLQRQPPRHHVGLLAVLHRRVVGHIDRFRDRARDERLAGRHHVNVARDGEEALAFATTRIGAIEHRQVLALDVGGTLERHRAADVLVGGFDIASRKTQMGEQIEARLIQNVLGHLEVLRDELFTQRPAIEREFDVEGAFDGHFDLREGIVGEALGFERRVIDGRRLAQGTVTDGIGLDLGDLRLAIAERTQGCGHGAVDDFEISAAGELLEFDQSKVGLDAGRIAIHDETDRARGRDHRRLRIAKAVLLAQLQRAIPGARCCLDEVRIGARRTIQRHRQGGERLVTLGLSLGGPAMIADDAQHIRGIGVVTGERPQLPRHFGTRRVGDTRHDGRDGAADGASLGAVIADPRRHQQAADVGKSQAQRAVAIGQLRNLAAGKLRHHYGDFEHNRPEPAAMLEGFDVEGGGGRHRCATIGTFATAANLCAGLAERHQVERGQIAGRVVEKHVFRARIGRPDGSRLRAGVPVVDRRVELDAGVGGRPGGVADLFPELARLERLDGLVGDAGFQIPIAILEHGTQKLVRHPHRVVRILARDREIGLAVPIGVVGREIDVFVALLGELDDAQDVVLRHLIAPRVFDGALEGWVFGGIEAGIAIRFAVDARRHDRLEALLANLGAGNEGGNLLLLLHLPIDVGLDIGMIDVDDDHLCRAPRGATRFDGASRPIADLEETHQSRRASTAR